MASSAVVSPSGAERKATNKYYPPDWDPSKGSINTFVGQHPLRERARKLDQGILIIRFEMPFSIWCEGCENHIGKAAAILGVRYNAEKKKIGNYYSTPIWQFRMKCHLCSSWIEIHTDPKNAAYQIISGARKREEDYSPEDNETIALKDAKEAERLQDPMYKLEQGNRDIQKAIISKSAIADMLEYNEKMWKDPFSMSQKTEKKIREDEAKESAAIKDKHRLLIDILPATKEDELVAKSTDFGVKKDPQNQLKESVLSRSIFPSASSSSLVTRNSGSKLLKHALVGQKRISRDPFAKQQFDKDMVATSMARPTKQRKLSTKDISTTVTAVEVTKNDDQSEQFAVRRIFFLNLMMGAAETVVGNEQPPVSLWGPGYSDIEPLPSVKDIEDMAAAIDLLESDDSRPVDVDKENVRRHPPLSTALPDDPESQDEEHTSTKSAPFRGDPDDSLGDQFLPGNAKIWVKTMGCSHNVSDGEYMAGLLRSQGYTIVFEDAQKHTADLWLLNSCTVKAPSELAFVSDIKRGTATKKKIVVAGCVPSAAGASGTSIASGKGRPREWDGLSIVGVQQIDRVVEVVEETLKGNVVKLTKDKKIEVVNEDDSERSERKVGAKRKAGGAKLDLPKVRRNPYVEIIPINTGCLNQCTYCKTKHARGDLGSYAPKEIWERCESVILEGVKEIWLTSEDTGAYGRDIGVTIVDLLWGIVNVLEKYPESGTMLRVGMVLRHFVSFFIADLVFVITHFQTNPPYILEHLDEIVKILSHPRVFSFLHVPVQSGSDRVLDAMRRQYTANEFSHIVRTLRDNVSPQGCTVATDVICGFPTETEEDFDETMALLESLRFSVLHISQFYSRPGTPAALMQRLPSEVVKARSRRVTTLFNKWLPFEGLEGTRLTALVTEVSADGRFYVGHDKLYRQVLVPMDARYMGRWLDVEVVRTGKFFLEGKVLGMLGLANEVMASDAVGGSDDTSTQTRRLGKGAVVKRKKAPKLVNVAGKMVKVGNAPAGEVPEAEGANDDGTELSVPKSFERLQDSGNTGPRKTRDPDEEPSLLRPAIAAGLGVFALAYGFARLRAQKARSKRARTGATGAIIVGGSLLVASGFFDLVCRTNRK
ncbi:hypothetical protein HDU84_008855 [Entophlyctis sp. JEL0112]|nr:hypothetical protein HDU84_008855 [Entophlyctis sp. JEL0112]